MLKAFLTFISGCVVLFSSCVYAGTVERGQFTTEVVEREPVDRIDLLDRSQNQIKYFTELRDLQGQSVTHQWVYDDEVIFEKTFDVRGPRWRIWTSKTIPVDKTGLWYVNTLDGSGVKLLTQSFEYR